jgi:hypothetical protein
MSSGELLGILVMLNNYLHDLAVAFLFAIMLVTWLLHRRGVLSPPLLKSLNRGFWASLVWVLIGGFIRAINYGDYEWLPAAGRGQVAGLIFKHILLAGLVVVGLFLQLHLSRRLRR